MKNLVLLSMLLMPALAMAQDDGMYFTPEKPVTKTNVREASVNNKRTIYTKPSVSVYNNSSRNEDEYNRMYVPAEEEYVDDYDRVDYDDENDFALSRRIVRFHSPRIGLAISSPFYWDVVYSYGAYDYLYDTYAYDPFFWDYGWRYGWSWGAWHSWHGPMWGWAPVNHWHSWHYGPACHWHHWGHGPAWGHGPGFHGGHIGHFRQQTRGTFTNRASRTDRIRTSALADGRTSRSGSGFRLTPQSDNRTNVRGTRSSSSRNSNFDRSSSRSSRNSNVNRSSSRSSRNDVNRSSSRSTRKSDVNSSSRSSRNSNVERSSSSRSSSRSSSSSFSSGGSSRSSGSFRGGSSRGGGSSSRGGGRSR